MYVLFIMHQITNLFNKYILYIFDLLLSKGNIVMYIGAVIVLRIIKYHTINNRYSR